MVAFPDSKCTPYRCWRAWCGRSSSSCGFAVSTNLVSHVRHNSFGHGRVHSRSSRSRHCRCRMRNRETGTGPAIVTPLDEEIAFASEDLDCGGAQRLVVTAVDFTRSAGVRSRISPPHCRSIWNRARGRHCTAPATRSFSRHRPAKALFSFATKHGDSSGPGRSGAGKYRNTHRHSRPARARSLCGRALSTASELRPR